ncbi:type II toxin-antitoxin system VapC family toxin [Sphingomonas gilva]|uniref:type II toxin-antitoxin system VapC family toxin n=1 Tax=Sphingomonas gilva TaxID=2305907 RepID=UPI0015FA834A|nr:type II toxin-antitoxin system VapC family toxin [Sphingomonas gilva]
MADASVVGPLLFKDEADALFPGLLDSFVAGECLVPGHWRLEIANQMLVGMRRKRATPQEADTLTAMFGQLPIAVDAETSERALGATYRLAVSHNLTIYDAAYLELALRRRLPLLSFDRDLLKAAAAENVPLFDTGAP